MISSRMLSLGEALPISFQRKVLQNTGEFKLLVQGAAYSQRLGMTGYCNLTTDENSLTLVVVGCLVCVTHFAATGLISAMVPVALSQRTWESVWSPSGESRDLALYPTQPSEMQHSLCGNRSQECNEVVGIWAFVHLCRRC